MCLFYLIDVFISKASTATSFSIIQPKITKRKNEEIKTPGMLPLNN